MQDPSPTAPALSPNPPQPDQQCEAMTLAAEKNPAGKIAALILSVIFLLSTWLAVADKLAPYSGNGFVSADTILIAPRVSGQISKVFIKDNQYIQTGNPLFALDPKPFDLAVRQAEVNLAQANQSVEINRAALSAMTARIVNANAALERAGKDAERDRALFERGAATKTRTDAADAALVAAETAAQVAQSDFEQAHLSVGGDHNPTLDAARNQLEKAKLNRTFATVMAPTSGHVTNLRLTPGQFVSVGGYAMTFIATDELWISIDLRENQLTNVEAGDAVSLLFDAHAGEIFEGVVESVAWGIDTGRTAANGLPQNKASTRWFEPARTIPVRIALQDSDWPEKVRVGSKVTAVVFAKGKGGLVPWIGQTLHHLQSYVSYIY